MTLRLGSLFSGVGGLEKGFDGMGTELAFVADTAPFPSQVLAARFDAPNLGDVSLIDAADVPGIDGLVGGFPCTDLSSAGPRTGLAGSRSGLWYQYERLAAAKRPAFCLVENVHSGAKHWVGPVSCGLCDLGYATRAIRVGAVDVGAPRQRYRIFIVAIRQDRLLEKGDGWSAPPEHYLRLRTSLRGALYPTLSASEYGS